jgi:hypothetical protein
MTLGEIAYWLSAANDYLERVRERTEVASS